MSDLKLEVCVDDADGLYAAIEGGADRIELCAALSVGGLTPNPGLMALAGPPRVPVYAMIRPRPGDFIFSTADLDVMRRDIDAVRDAGLAGVVLGASLADGRLDTSMLTKLTGHAAGLGMTLHRAFDLVPDFAEAMEIAVDLGFERILTSGGAKSAPQAIDRLAEITGHAAGRLSIMPGSGVTLDTVDALLSK
ncbi:MAG: copper homeostasis protein CutC, partial [Ensifer adhaerens]|nr:copper homeostasis protein CutC [Ensifer adhaerens]